MTEKIEASDETIGSGGFADVRSGRYMGRLVAVKTTRVGPWTNLQKIRKVRINSLVRAHLWCGLNSPAPAILQGSHPLEYTIPSERLETCWGSGRHEKTTIFQCVRLDGARVHHGVH